jgi:hypothetical protein
VSILTKAIHKLNEICMEIPVSVFTELDEIILKFVWNYKSQIAKTVLSKKKNKGKVTKIYIETTVIKTACYWYKSRHE